MPRSKSYQPKKFHKTNPTFPKMKRFQNLYNTKSGIPGPGQYQYDVPLNVKRDRERNKSSIFFRSGSKRIMTPGKKSLTGP
jgi:hypothetical protein